MADQPLTPEQQKVLLAEHQEDVAAGKEKTIRDAFDSDLKHLAAVMSESGAASATPSDATAAVEHTPIRTSSTVPKRVDWRATDMRGANLAEMDLEGVDFRAADLRGVNFSGSMLRNADFRGAYLDGANFQNANLYGAKMQGAEAGQADFRGADLRCVNFGGAYLLGALMPAPSVDIDAVKRMLGGSGETKESTNTKQQEREGR